MILLADPALIVDHHPPSQPIATPASLACFEAIAYAMVPLFIGDMCSIVAFLKLLHVCTLIQVALNNNPSDEGSDVKPPTAPASPGPSSHTRGDSNQEMGGV